MREIGFYRLPEIIGDRSKGIEPLIPVSKSQFWNEIRAGRYPRPVKLSPKVTVWRVSDINNLIKELSK